MSKRLAVFTNTAFLLIVSLLCILPFYYMFIMGTYTDSEMFTSIKVLPGTHMMSNLKIILSSHFLTFYWNSFYTSFLAALICVTISAMAGYALAKFDFKFRKKIHLAILATMMVPTQLGMIAYVIEMRNLHLNNTHASIILPFAAMAFGVFLMTSFMQEGIPTEVLESARIDGCSEPAIFMQIVFGFIKPVLGTLFLFVFIWSWNSYILPLVVLNKPSLATIPLGINTLGAAYSKEYALRILGLTLGTLPLIGFFIIFSKSFIQGVAAGALKG